MAQRFQSDGQWHLINGKVTDWAGVLEISAHQPPIIIRHGVAPEEALGRIRVALETLDDVPVPTSVYRVWLEHGGSKAEETAAGWVEARARVLARAARRPVTFGPHALGSLLRLEGIVDLDKFLLALAQQLLLRILATDLDELEVVVQTFSHFQTS